MPSVSYPIFNSENSALLRRMQETPSQLPNASIYQAWQQAPDHFGDNIDIYARQLGVGVFELFAKTQDFGPLERAVQEHTLPVVADRYFTTFSELLKMPEFRELLEVGARYLKTDHQS